MPELLLGCGKRLEKIVTFCDPPETWTSLWACDINPRNEPESDGIHFTEWDLEKTPWPWEDNQFDEVHAYEVLEHFGRQGDFRSFFAHFYEAWRVLKPGGMLCGSSPALSSRWLWGDPGHTRAITNESLTFLDQREYALQVDRDGGRTPMTDYRYWWKGDFRRIQTREVEGVFFYILQANKE